MGKTAEVTKKAAKKAARKPARLEYVLRLNLSTNRSWGSTMTAKAAHTRVEGWSIAKRTVMSAIHLSEAEWRELRTENKKLDVLRSDRLMLIDQLVERSVEVYGDKGKAERWLKRANPYLGNKAPVELLGSIDGIAKAMAELDRIEAGVFA